VDFPDLFIPEITEIGCLNSIVRLFICLKGFRRIFLRSAAVYSGAKVLGTNQVVPAQNLLFDGSLRYQTDPSNLWEGFKTHWIGQVFG